MTAPHEGGDEERLLLLAPTPKDAAVTRQVFEGLGVACTPVDSVERLCAEVAAGAGAVVLTEHALGLADIGRFADRLRHQPPWSDLPVVMLAAGGANSAAGRQALEWFGNVTVLERPVHMASLASVVQTLIRSRRRQYQIREHLREREDLLAAERAARTEAERAGRMKDEFLATLSHELRTPLNAIFGWSQILQAGAASEADLLEGLGTIERNARAQAQIIDDLLDMSRIINGTIRLDIRPIDIRATIEAALETVRPAAEARGIQIQTALGTPGAGTIAGDPGRLQQVFWNLLSNAVKFTPAGGRISVRLERAASNLQVSVIDTGEGIRPEFLPHVFDRFRQADASTTRRHGGLGLGLAIVKQLVELHGGTIRADSPGAGRGSTFVVSLPVAAPPAESGSVAGPGPLPSTSADGASSRRRNEDRVVLSGVIVLVVDDEPDARALVRRVLEDCQATVVTAASSAEALDLIRTRPPTVLISDIGMPHEDGYALIRAVRALGPDQGGDTPAIALTAYARSEDRVRAIQHGFQMHVVKPVEPAELVTVVASLAGPSPHTGNRLGVSGRQPKKV
jgi:signal transduction histidine kinase/ActR/RegA family two-component response regulator